MDSTEELLWTLKCPNFYVPIEKALGKHAPPEHWDACPLCDQRPRLWVFDHGRHARCLCGEYYAGGLVNAVGLGTYYKTHGSLEGYPDDQLRVNWNAYIAAVQSQVVIESARNAGVTPC